MKSFFSALFLLFFFIHFYGQQLNITVKDSATMLPLNGAMVYCAQYDQTLLTSGAGQCTMVKNGNPLSFKVSALGYRSVFVTVSPSQETLSVSMIPVHLDLHEVTVSSGALVQSNKNPFHIESQKLNSLEVISNLTLGEALAKIPGVYNASLGNGITKPVIRGMQGMRVVTLLNGLRIEGQQWGGDHGMGITSLGVSSVEVIKGPASLLYGADALGGVIYLVDAPFAATGKRSVDFQTDFFSNTLGGRAQLLLKESHNKFRWLVGLTYANHADFQLPSGKFAKNSRFNDLGAKASISFTGKRSLFGLRYTVSHSAAGIPGHTHDSLATPMTFQVEERARSYELPAQFFQNHLLQATANFYRDKHSTMVMVGSTLNKLIEYDEKVTIPSLSMNLLNYLGQVKWQYNFNKAFNLVTGIQSMLQVNSNAINASDSLIPNAKMLDVGAFLNINLERNQWNVQAGVRYDQRRLFDLDLPNQPTLQFNGLNGSIGGVYSAESWVFRTTISTGFRAPHLTELFSNGYHHGALRFEVGDAKLRSEQASQLDLTVEHTMPHGTVVINPFVNYIQNYIFLSPMGLTFDGIPGYQYVQNQAVLFSGVDASLHAHPHFAHGLHWELSLSYIHPESLGDSSVSLIPQPRIQNVIRYEFQKKNRIRLKEVNLQSVLMGPQNQVAYLESPSKAYHVLDFSSIVKLGKTNKFTLKAGVRNILNANYIDHLSRMKNIQLPFPGRNYFLSVAYQITSNLKNKSYEN
jgi:iron complex outermembrane receptor protein